VAGSGVAVFTERPESTSALLALLAERGHRVDVRRIPAAGSGVAVGDADLVVVDWASAPVASAALLAALEAHSERAGFLLLVRCAPGDQSRIELSERRVAALRERKQVLKALEESHANLTALIENTDDFILFSDREGRPLVFNAAYAALMKQLLGLDMEPGIKPHELLPDEERRAFWEDHHRRVLAGERFTIDYVHEAPDGQPLHLEVSYNPVHKDGEIIGFSEFTRDVTERRTAAEKLARARDELEAEVAKRTAELEQSNASLRAEIEHRERTEEALRKSEQKYRGVYDIAPLAFVLWDRECRVLAWNRQAEQTFGWTAEEALGRSFFDLIIPDVETTRVEEIVAGLLDGSLPGHVVNENSTKSGETIVCEWNNALLYNPDGSVAGAISLGLDVTDRKAMELRLQRAEKLESIGQLAGGIAHDFNNQLVGILAYAELIQRRSRDDRVSEFAKSICESAHRSADLIDKLLAFARKAKSVSDPIDLQRVLADVAALMRQRKGLEIEIVERYDSSATTTEGDPTLLHNALLNLAINARDAMPEGGTLTLSAAAETLTEADCRARPDALSPGEYVRVSVSDTGVGMDDRTKARAFEPFFTTKEHGTGMGLAAVYGAVKSHGGAIDVVSSLGAGTEFVALFPFVPCREIEEPGPRRGVEESVEKARVLIVDDEELVRESLGSILGALGHEVIVSPDGEDAIATYTDRWQAIDLVILDMVMPGLDGLSVLTRLREINPRVRALLSSGYAIESRVDDLLDAGLSGFLQKPYTVDAVADKVRAALER